jgi:hypothetical protein
LDEPIDQSLLPDELKEKHIEKWSDIEARAKWRIGDAETIDAESPEEKDASKLRPDFVALNVEKTILYILDAKYYVPAFSDSSVNGCPGVGDVNKQHLYQLTYRQLIMKNQWKVVNAFLMPESHQNFHGAEKAEKMVTAYCTIFEDIMITQENDNDNENGDGKFRFVYIQTLFLDPGKLFGYYLDGNSKLIENEMLHPLDPDNFINQTSTARES